MKQKKQERKKERFVKVSISPTFYSLLFLYESFMHNVFVLEENVGEIDHRIDVFVPK
jgi:hypothetical protein